MFVNVRASQNKKFLVCYGMKEGGHVSKLLLFLDIIFVCFFQQKRKWLERGRERKKLLRK